jgi:hypothetical protein
MGTGNRQIALICVIDRERVAFSNEPVYQATTDNRFGSEKFNGSWGSTTYY